MRMSIKPILFNTEMVRAILDGRKTQTRRVVKEFAGEEILSVSASDGTEIGKYGRDGWRGKLPDRHDGNTYCVEAKPPCKVGDILWVRETWGKLTECDVFPPYEPNEERFIYRADIGDPDHFQAKWHPSIHMPREAARIFLRVMDVRVERLQDITEEQAVMEGFSAGCFEISGGPLGVEDDPETWTAVEVFDDLWNSTIKPKDRDIYGWYANPWVWVITFERCERPFGWYEVL